MFYRNYLEELYLPTSLSSAHYQDTVEWTVKTLSSQLFRQFFTETVELTVKTLLSQLSRQFFTESVELTVKTLLSHLVTGESNSPTHSLRTHYGSTQTL